MLLRWQLKQSFSVSHLTWDILSIEMAELFTDKRRVFLHFGVELTNKISNLRAECSRSALDWISHDEHLARTHELEREQLEWTKKLAGDEAKLKQLEAELRDCKEECAMWEEVDVDEEVDFSGDA